MGVVVIGHCVVVPCKKSHQFLGHPLGEVGLAELGGSEDLDAEVHQLFDLIPEDWEVQMLEVLEGHQVGWSKVLRKIYQLESTLNSVLLLLRLPIEEIDGGQLQLLRLLLGLVISGLVLDANFL